MSHRTRDCDAAGSGVDAITRAAQPALAKALGTSVIVDNQPGAGGIVGLQALARSAPDGFTLSKLFHRLHYPKIARFVRIFGQTIHHAHFAT